MYYKRHGNIVVFGEKSTKGNNKKDIMYYLISF